MKQVVVIHGGDSFLDYKEYLRYLKSTPVSSNTYLPRRGWKEGLPKALGSQYQVLLPRMPNNMNARFLEWKVWFERMFPYIKSNVVLIGHSQGGIFLLKYLTEKKFPKKIRALILVAPPHNKTKGVGDFRIVSSVHQITQQCRNIIFFHSQDDPIVPFTELARYQQQLPDAAYMVYTKRGHFTGRTFPEIIRLIKSLN